VIAILGYAVRSQIETPQKSKALAKKDGGAEEIV